MRALKNILVITPYYSPDIGPSAPIFTTLCEELVALGHQVTCITSVPHYTEEIHSKSGRWPSVARDIKNGVELVRIGVPLKRGGGVINRLAYQLSFNVGALLVSLFTKKRDICIIDGPVLWSGLACFYWSMIRRVRYIYNQHDIFPDVAWRLGWLSRGVVFRAWDRIEKLLYMRAEQVLVLAISAQNLLVEKGIPLHKISLFPVPVDFSEVDLEHPIVDFKEEWGLIGKFVVFYGGNFGQSQRLLELAEVAKVLLTNNSIHFVLVGEGDKKRELEEYVQTHGLTNISIYPFQERQFLFDMYRSFDCGIAPLFNGLAAEIVPSKAIYMMAAGMPIIAWGDETSELARIIFSSRCGLVVEGGVDLLGERLRSLAYDKSSLRQMSSAGTKYARERFDVKRVVKLVSEICQR